MATDNGVVIWNWTWADPSKEEDHLCVAQQRTGLTNSLPVSAAAVHLLQLLGRLCFFVARCIR